MPEGAPAPVHQTAPCLPPVARSRYYPVTLAGVLAEIQKTPESRFALVGIPRFVKAARLLARQDPFFARAIRFHIGLVCGHLKSSAYAECLGWLAGLAPDDLENVELRRKTPGQPANHDVFAARSNCRPGRAGRLDRVDSAALVPEQAVDKLPVRLHEAVASA